jgi:hypothetical protein
VQRWLARLAARGQEPLVITVAKGVHHSYETDLCEALVDVGARLLNMTPSAPRIEGRLVVDVEREAQTMMADVVHLNLSASAEDKSGTRDPVHVLMPQIAAMAFRRLADILDPTSKARCTQYEGELAYFFAWRVIDWVNEGKVDSKARTERGRLDEGERLLRAKARSVIRLARAAAAKTSPPPLISARKGRARRKRP